MRGFTCEVGEKFGEWTVISPVFVKNGHNYVTVQCKCGKIQELCLSDLRNGRAHMCKSCSARNRGQNIKIGDKSKHWTVVEEPILNSRRNLLYKVQCDCGRTTRLMSGYEFFNPNKALMCQQCAAELRGKTLAESNGKVGELKLTRYSKLQRSASVRGIPFEVSMEYLWNLFETQNHKCAITGDYIKHLDEASLDRIDSSKGYVEGNVQWTTYQANVSKHTMTMEALYNFCRKVLSHANQQPSTSLTTCEGSETNS